MINQNNQISKLADTTLILGKGFLGTEFIRRGYKYFTTRADLDLDKLFKTPGSINGDYKDEIYYALNDIISEYKSVDITIKNIINCIGIADTRFCEDPNNFQQILNVNGEFVNILSQFCNYKNIKLVHISTGCLYTSKGHLVKETDFIEAHCNYVVSKWVGEMGCNKSTDLIIRPRLYFSDVPNKLNLICKLPRFKYILNELNSVTSTRTIVDAVTCLLNHNQTGIFNVCNSGNYTIKQLSEAIGYKWNENQVIRGDDLVKSQGLYLVNNTMDISKLEKFYKPTDALTEIVALNNIMKKDNK